MSRADHTTRRLASPSLLGLVTTTRAHSTNDNQCLDRELLLRLSGTCTRLDLEDAGDERGGE